MDVDDEAYRAARECMARLLREIEPGAFAPHHHHGVGLEESSQPHPLAALRAAHLLQGSLRAHVAVAALAARGQGETWSAVADALGMGTDGEPDAHAAFLTVAAVRPNVDRWSGQLSVAWTCSSCQGLVRDRGLQWGAAADREVGHAPTCTRHVESWLCGSQGGDR